MDAGELFFQMSHPWLMSMWECQLIVCSYNHGAFNALSFSAFTSCVKSSS